MKVANAHAAAESRQEILRSIDRATITIRRDRSGLITRDLKAQPTMAGHRARGARLCLRKRVNGEVNDGEVLINGSTMGVEFASFGEA